MRIAWATDVHLNFLSGDDKRAFVEEIIALRPEALIVTGDISESKPLHADLDVLRGARVPFFFVLGNHDYYDSDIATVRASVAQYVKDRDSAQWLPAAGVVALTDHAALVGCDGWGDGRLGDPFGSRVLLNDFLHIGDLAGLDGLDRITKLRSLGDAEAQALTQSLRIAASGFSHVLVATHVPPFRGACWHEGAISSDEWLPFFTCDAVGKLLEAEANAHPETRFTVLCGHTHGAGRLEVRDNLTVLTGAAEYGAPVVRAFQLD